VCEARPVHFAKLSSVCLVGLGCKARSLICWANRQLSVPKVLSDNDMDLFFTISRDRFRLQKLQCLPISFRPSNLCYAATYVKRGLDKIAAGVGRLAR
jgi:hypothetical protein